MDKSKIKEIAIILDNHMRKYQNETKSERQDFLMELLRKYNFTDEEWEEVVQEWNRKMDKELLTVRRKNFFSSTLLNIISWICIGYASIFFCISLIYIYDLPSQIIYPEGANSDIRYITNTISLILFFLGIFLIYVKAHDKNT